MYIISENFFFSLKRNLYNIKCFFLVISIFQGIKSQNYDSNKFSNNKAIIMFSLKYPQFNLGFSWIIRLRCGYKYNTTIAIRMGRVSEDCPKSCPLLWRR